jgi:deazaflavin-dependent oxidoreductase (nitroreductase family)
MAVVELHTIGRKSGLSRSSMLTSPLSDEHRIVLVASRGGSDQHPSWYVNLRANPDVEITMRGRRTPWRARTASPEEKAELWPRIVATYKQYDDYEKKSARELPVVILEPRAA